MIPEGVELAMDMDKNEVPNYLYMEDMVASGGICKLDISLAETLNEGRPKEGAGDVEKRAVREQGGREAVAE